jgi:hypothetical protein
MGGTGGGGSALFDEEDARAEPNVIDRDLRNVNDSLRRRPPVDVGDVTDGAGEVDGSLVRGGIATSDGCDGGKGCCAGCEIEPGTDDVGGDTRDGA